MPFDPTTVVQDPRWDALAQDPDKLAKAEERLWSTFVSSYPDYSAKLQAMPQDKQEAERARFSGMLRTKFPTKFPKAQPAADVPKEIPEPVSAPEKSVATPRASTSFPSLDLRDAMTGASAPDSLVEAARTAPDLVKRVPKVVTGGEPGVLKRTAENLVAGAAEAGTQTMSFNAELVRAAGEKGDDIRRNFITLKNEIARKIAPDWYAEREEKLRKTAPAAELRADKPNAVTAAGETAAEYWNKQLDTIQKTFPSGDITENPELLADPAWWSRSVASAFTSMSQAYVMGGGTVRGAAVVGAGMEAVPEYRSMIEEGRPANEAASRALAFGAVVAGLEKVGLDKIFHGASPSRIRRVLAASIAEGGTEWAEEPSGALLRDLGNEGITPTELGKRVMTAAWKGLNVLPASMLVGGGASAMNPAAERNEEPQTPVQPLEKPAAEVPAVESTADKPPAEPVEVPAIPEAQRWRSVTPQEDVRVAGRWQVVPAASLITSDKPEYDQELQPRNRNTAASQEQIAKIALGPDPLRLDDSAVTDSGSPIVDERGQVISGNGRTIGLRKAYASGRAGPYDAFVQDRARQLGLSVEGIENPVLVRQILDTGGQSLAKIAELSNRPQILQRTDAELAEADAKILLGSEIMDVFNPDAIGTVRAGSNRDFNRAFVLATGDQSLRASDGSFAPAIEGRVRRAVLAAVLGRSPNGRELVRQALEQADTLGIKRQLDGIMVAGGQLLKIGKQKPQFDITGHLADALQAYMAYKRDLANGLVKNLADYVAQGDMFAGERGQEVQYLLEELDQRQSIRAIKEFIDEYARLVSRVDTTTAALFGDVPETTAVQLIGRARNAGKQTTEIAQGNDQGAGAKPAEPAPQAVGRGEPEDARKKALIDAKTQVLERIQRGEDIDRATFNPDLENDGEDADGETSVREPAADYPARSWKEWRVDLVRRRGDTAAKAFDKIRVKDGVEAAIKYARQELAEQQDLIDGKEIPFKLVGDVIVQADKPAAKPDPNANQMTLFDGGAKQSTQLWLDGLFDNGPQAGNVQKWEPGYEQRPEAKAENRDLARKALTAYVDRVRGVRRSLPGGVEVLARAVTGNLVRQGYQSFVGQKLTKPEDVWPYIELARNPQFELLRFLMVKDGVIVDDMIVTSRLPGAVQWGDVYEAELIERIKASGADRVHQLHNHPSGRTRPSGEDVQLTASTDFSLEKALGRQILGEHIVIDHGEISIITARRMGPPGSTNYQTIVETLTNKEVAAIPDPLKQPEVPHSILGTQIDSPLDIAGALRVAKMNEPDAIYLVGRTNDGRISGIGRLPLDAFTKSDARGLALIRNFARHMGSGQVIIGNVPANISHADGIKILGAFSVNAVLDVLDTKGNSMRDKLGVREGRPDVFFGAKIGTRQVRAPAAGWPGGELGEPGVPVPIADDPDQHMPIELPELVKLYNDLTGGRYPKIVRKLRGALGVFSSIPGQRGPENIKLLASAFKLITPEEEAVMRADAKAFVAANPGLVTPSMTAEKLEEERFTHLYETAYQDALTKNPKLASKVMAHELMHFVDFLPDLAHLHTRGNILGHVAAFRGYLLKSLAALPSSPELAIDPAVRKQLRKDAAKLAGKRPPKTDPAAVAVWNDAVSKEYARLIQDYADANGFVTVAGIKAELEPLIAWWRHGGTKMEPYFREPWEMFAEAGSIMLNNPAAVAKRAPKFFRLFHDWLPQSRPEILREYNAIQDAIKSGTVQRDRVQHLRSELGRSTEIAGGLEQQSNRLTWRERADRFRYTFSRVFGPTLWRVKRIKDPNARSAVEQAIGDYLYRKTHHELYLARVRNEVMVPLLKAGLDFMDLAEFMFHNHVVNNRADIANPYGWTAKTSAERLAELQRDLPPEKWRALVAVQAEFWNVRQGEVINKVKQSEIFDTAGEDVIENRQFYHTVAPVRANAMPDPQGSDIESLLAGSFGVHVGAKLAKQYGFLGSIKNPFLATMQKDLALLNMAYRESAKRAIIDALINSPFANEWKPAEMVWTGQRREVKEIKTNRVGTLIFVHRGKVHAFYGPRSLVDAFEYGDPIENRMFAALNRALAQTWTRLWTQWNYGFWPIAYARDIGAFRDQMPGTKRFGPRSFWAFRGKARAAARSSIMGEPDAAARDALGRGVVVSRVEPMGEPIEPDPIDELLVRHNIPPASWRVPPAVTGAPSAAAPVVNAIRRGWELWRTWGQVNERTVKIAGLMYLDKFYPSMPEAKKRELVREMSGSPDFLSRGAGASYVNLLLPLYNPIVRGVESTAKSWKDRPGERAWKSIKYTLLPLLGFELLRRGLMSWLIGDEDSKEIQALIDSVPTYDRDNYKIWPLGWVDRANKKVAYLRIPMHEGERMLHVIISKLLRADKQPMDTRGLFNVTAGQAPGINPLLKVAGAWYTYGITGVAPIDSFNGSQLMSTDEALAGEGKLKLARHTWNQLGGTIVVRFGNPQETDAEPTRMEKFLRLPVISNTLGRWVKVSNRGVSDRLEVPRHEVEVAQAKTRLRARDMIERGMAGQPFTASDKLFYKTDPYFKNYVDEKWTELQKLKLATPELRALLRAGSSQEQAAVLQEIMRGP